MAYHGKSELWSSKEKYDYIFNSKTHAGHIVFVYSLDKAIREYKLALNQIDDNKKTQNEKDSAAFLGNRGSIPILTAAIGSSMELIVGKKIDSKFELEFTEVSSIEEYTRLWRPVVDFFLTSREKLERPLKGKGLRDEEEVTEAIKSSNELIEGIIKAAGKTALQAFIHNVKTNNSAT